MIFELNSDCLLGAMKKMNEHFLYLLFKDKHSDKTSNKKATIQRPIRLN